MRVGGDEVLLLKSLVDIDAPETTFEILGGTFAIDSS